MVALDKKQRSNAVKSEQREESKKPLKLMMKQIDARLPALKPESSDLWAKRVDENAKSYFLLKGCLANLDFHESGFSGNVATNAHRQNKKLSQKAEME